MPFAPSPVSVTVGGFAEFVGAVAYLNITFVFRVLALIFSAVTTDVARMPKASTAIRMETSDSISVSPRLFLSLFMGLSPRSLW